MSIIGHSLKLMLSIEKNLKFTIASILMLCKLQNTCVFKHFSAFFTYSRNKRAAITHTRIRKKRRN